MLLSVLILDWVATTPSLLDLVFTNEPYMVRDIIYLPGLGNSDHICLCFSLLFYAHLKDTKVLRCIQYTAC